MSISKTKRNFLGLLTLFTILSGSVGAVILHYLLPGSYFKGYPFILIYFFIFGVFNIYMFDACRQYAPQKLLLVYMAMKIIKFLMSAVIMVFYCVTIRACIKEFLLTFVVFYLMYLIYETWFFFTFEWNRKKKKQKAV